MPKNVVRFSLDKTETALVIRFLDEQRKSFTREQWMDSYQSWNRGGKGWREFELGGTDINSALAWYQHVLSPGSKEWRPAFIVRAALAHACRWAESAPELSSATAGGV